MAEIFPVKSASFLLDFASCSAATALCSVMSTPQVTQVLSSDGPIARCEHAACGRSFIVLVVRSPQFDG